MRIRSRLVVVPPAVTLLGVTLLAGACGSAGDTRPAPRDARDAASAALRVFATGETRGFLTPCGCEERQLGGMPRRASYLADAGRPGDLRIDLGNAAAGAGALRDLRIDATLEALDRLGYAAFVPGELEILAADALAVAACGGRAVRVVSANLRGPGEPGGRAAFDEFVLHALPDGRTAAVIGLSPEVEGTPAGWTIEPPGEALARVLPAATAAADVVIVAAAISDGAAFRLVSGTEGVALLVAPRIPDTEATMTATFSTSDADEALRAGPPPLAVVGDFAGFVRRVDFDTALAPGASWRAWLSEDWPDEPRMAAFVADVHDRAVALDPTLVPDILKGLVARGTAGSEICAECHAAEYAVWRESGHAHAMATLVARDSARDPGCVPCHLVDLPGPFTDEPPTDFAAAAGDGVGVGCEACHGGRREHVENAMNGVVPPGGAPPWSARDTCRGCHHPPEVKRFDFDEAWASIRHGAK